MGASASKASRTAAGAAARKYPTRPPPPTASPPAPTVPNATSQARPPPPPQSITPGPTVYPTPQAHNTRSEAINLDASDPDFAQSLRSLGPVQPNPTLSPSSAFQSAPPNSSAAALFAARGPDPRSNPALQILAARERLVQEAEQESEALGTISGRNGGRQFLDVYTIRQILELRDGNAGKSAAETEKALGLKKGVVARLGEKGVVELPNEIGRAEKEIRMV